MNFKEMWQKEWKLRWFTYLVAGAFAVRVVLWAASKGWISL